MKYSGYQLVSQLRAGKDGVAYLACETASGNSVELRDLTRAASQPRRWTRLSRQVQRVAMLLHPCARRLTRIQLDADPRFVVLNLTPGRTIADYLRDPSDDAAVAAKIGVRLSNVLVCAHALGIPHGNLRPSQVWLSDENRPIVDFTQFLAMGESSEPVTRLDQVCLPSAISEFAVDPAANDVFALGAIVALLSRIDRIGKADVPIGPGDHASLELQALIDSMMSNDPMDRPMADEVLKELCLITGSQPERAVSESISIAQTESIVVEPVTEGIARDYTISEQGKTMPAMELTGRRLGRFQLGRRIGIGATGAVYRAQDIAEGTTVAVKVLHPQHAGRKQVVQRFRHEAKILATIDNPHVAKLVDINYEAGLYFLAMEYVEGQDLASILAQRGPIEHTQALSILSDVARALVEPHERGIVHRDVKPENILVRPRASDAVGPVAESAETLPDVTWLGSAILVDFGLARGLFESDETNLGGTGTVLGTPAYMSPEQCNAEPIGPETDVYAMGATLFHALAGRPPFIGKDARSLIDQHRNQPPPRVTDHQQGLSAPLADLVDRTLSKVPARRQADAAALLSDLDRAMRGEPMTMDRHPIAPTDQADVMRFNFEWALRSSPPALWPHVSNTERLNEAIGLSAVHYSPQPDQQGGVEQTASLRRLGVEFQWQEHPFEWIEGQRLSVLRDFHKGPFKWLINIVELHASADGGTRLSHSVLIEPRSLLGRAAAALEVGVKAKRALKRVYHHIDRSIDAKQDHDPFREPGRVRAARRRRLEGVLERLKQRGLNDEIVRRLGTFVAQAPPQEIARIRPLTFAHRFGLNAESVVETCLAAAHEGLLVLLWDILCPLCRIPSDIKETLRELESHGQCPACNAEYEIDFAQSVEMIFRVSPQIREADTRTYCIGGPAHSPHVVAQIRVGSKERFRLDLSIGEGSYCLRGTPEMLSVDFDVGVPGQTAQWEVEIDADTPRLGPEMTANRQRFWLTNRTEREQLVRIERTSPRNHVLTATRAASMAAFREWFPDEILAPGQLVGVAAMSLMTTGLAADPDKSEISAALQSKEYFTLVANVVQRYHGTTLKAQTNHIRVAFEDSSHAVQAALVLRQKLADHERLSELGLRIAIDHGSAVAVTIDNQLDYLGETAEAADQLFAIAKPGELTMSARVSGDPVVAMLLNERDLDVRVSTHPRDDANIIVHHARLV